MATLSVSFAIQAQARDYIPVVGSFTMFPFSTAVAENFGRKGTFKTPKIESTGTGSGIKLFCACVGVDNPYIANISRRMKAAEFDQCADKGVKEKDGSLTPEMKPLPPTLPLRWYRKSVIKW